MSALADELATALGARVVAMTPVDNSGDINAAGRAELADGRACFVKSNARAPRGMFAAEAAGLAWLRGDGDRDLVDLHIPDVLAVADTWLALEWLALGGRPDPVRFGRALARLHRRAPPVFGGEPNFLATLAQDNTPCATWPELYIERHLRPLCTRAKLGADRALDALLARPDRFGPPEPPARLHGDLWWGNVASVADVPAIFDPATYGGHREIDLAMLALFGDLPDRFVAAYAEVWPLADGWRDRIALHQLYPLAAHACLFGGGYGAQVMEILRATSA